MILQVSKEEIISFRKHLEDFFKTKLSLSSTEVPVCRDNPRQKYKQDFTLKGIMCE